MRTGPARAGAAAVLASAAFLAPPAGAATFTVSTTADSGAGSLRQAVLDANASGTDDTIAFSGALAGQTITLAGGPLVVAKPGTSLLVDGATLSPRVQVSGGGTSGLLDVTAGTVTVRQLQLRDGRGPDGVAGAPGAGNASGGGGGGGGGAVVNQQGATLVLDSSLITGNTGGNGGAGGDSGLAGGGGGGGGGAIVNAGTMWVIGSTLESNRGGDGGVPGASTSGGFGTGGGGAGAGAITNTGGGTLTIQNSTLVANVGGTGARGPVPLSAASGAGAGGGGAGGAAIANNAGGVLNVLNSTLFRNTGGPGGAGGTNVDGQKINGMSGGGGGGPLGGGGGGGGQLGVSAPGGPGGVAGNSGGSGGFDSIAAQPGVGAGGGGGGGAASAGGAGGPEGGGGGGGDSAAGGGGAGGGGAGGGSSSASASASGGGGGFGGGGAGGDNEAGSAPGTSASGFGGSGGVGRTSPGGLVITPATAGTFGGGGGGAGDRTGAAAAPGSVGSAALVAAGGGATVNSSIFAGSLTPLATPTNECRGTVTGSANLLQDPAACTRAAGDTRSGDPLLDPAGLKDNGGPTPTIGLQAGSQAIDTGANPAALPFDQRGPGFARTVHGTPDIGALELPSVRVVKDLSPLSDPGRFDLSIGSNVVAAEVGDDGAGEVVMPVRTDVTVAETAVGAATSRPYDSSIDCGSGSQAGTSRQLLNVVSSVTCTFTNRYRPTITVTKRVVPAGDRGRFDLHVDGTPVETGVGDGGRGSRIVAGGSSVTVSETGAAGTSLSDYATTIDCGGGSQAGSSLTLTNVAGDTACTITNARRPFTGGCANPRIGTAAGERIDGSALGDLIYGLGGNDTLFGAAGTDCLFGADGDDTLWGNDGKDWLWAGAGDDSLYGRAGGDKLRGEANADRLSGGKGNDGLKGGPGNDRLAGHTGRDFLSGGHGADSLNGGKGIDTYFGRRGVDRVRAADGRRERVNCGPGDDTAIVDARDATTGCEKRTVRR